MHLNSRICGLTARSHGQFLRAQGALMGEESAMFVPVARLLPVLGNDAHKRHLVVLWKRRLADRRRSKSGHRLN